MPIQVGYFPTLAIKSQLGRDGRRTSRENRQLQLRHVPVLRRHCSLRKRNPGSIQFPRGPRNHGDEIRSSAVGGSGNRTLPGGGTRFAGPAEGRPEEARRSRAGPAWRGAGASRIMDAANEKGSPKQLRVRSLGTRLSEAEYAQCEKSAARRGLTTGERRRQVLLEAAVASPAQEPEAEAILSEILA